MQTKLTLRLDDELIARAKAHARRSGRSVSELVAQFFALLGKRQHLDLGEPLPPTTKSLRGVLRGRRAEERDYDRHLEKKYR